MIARTAELVCDARATLGEGPQWDDETGVLDWLDVPAGAWHRIDRDGRARPSRSLGGRISCLRRRRAGGHVVAVDGGLLLLAADGTEQRRLAVPAADGAVLNDGGCDAHGRMLVGSVAPDPREGALHRIDADGRVSVVRRGVAMSNGIAWSPHGTWLYHVDSAAGTVTALAYDADSGTVGTPRELIRVPSDEGMPDGLAVDVDGGLWLAVWGAGEVRRYTPDGRLDGRVRVPASQVTSCTLGDGRVWITTAREGLSAAALEGEPLAGAVFACDSPSGALPSERFAG